MVLKPFHSNAVVIEFISTRSGLPRVLLRLSWNAGSAVLEPGHTALSCCSCCLRALRPPGTAPAAAAGMGARGGPCEPKASSGRAEPVSLLPTEVVVGKGSPRPWKDAVGFIQRFLWRSWTVSRCRQLTVSFTAGEYLCIYGYFRTWGQVSRGQLACTCTLQFTPRFAEGAFAGSGILHGKQSCQITDGLCEKPIFSSLVVSFALQRRCKEAGSFMYQPARGKAFHTDSFHEPWC